MQERNKGIDKDYEKLRKVQDRVLSASGRDGIYLDEKRPH